MTWWLTAADCYLACSSMAERGENSADCLMSRLWSWGERGIYLPDPDRLLLLGVWPLIAED